MRAFPAVVSTSQLGEVIRDTKFAEDGRVVEQISETLGPPDDFILRGKPSLQFEKVHLDEEEPDLAKMDSTSDHTPCTMSFLGAGLEAEWHDSSGLESSESALFYSRSLQLISSAESVDEWCNLVESCSNGDDLDDSKALLDLLSSGLKPEFN